MARWPVLGLMCSTLLLFACSSRVIHGIVRDAFDKPLADVKVSVEHSTFAGTSASNGEYSLDYAPGNFTLIFTHPGYTTIRVPLVVTQKIAYPVDIIRLYPVPPDAGIWWVGPEKLVKIANPTPVVKMGERRRNFFDSPTIRYLVVLGQFPVLTKPGNASFIDASPQLYSLAKLGPGGVIGRATMMDIGITERFECTACMKEKASKIGDEQLLIRTFDLEAGQYAWVPFQHNSRADAEMGASKLPASISYTFTVN